MSDLIWLHEDCLSNNHQLFKEAKSATKPFFVWDEEYLQAANYSFKRLVFIYETLSEMNCEIYLGKTAEVILEIADNLDSKTLFTATTPNPDLQKIIKEIGNNLLVKVISEQPFVKLEAEPNLRRFFNYWNKAAKSAMQIDGG